MNKIWDEISEKLENIIEYDYTSIKNEIEKILSNHKYKFKNYKVICDNTNNYLDIDKYLKVDIWVQPNSSYQTINITITISKNRGKALREQRKKKLLKIYGK